MFTKKRRNGIRKIGCAYRLESEEVEFPEGFVCCPNIGLLLDRETIARTIPGTARALARNLVATTFAERCVRLYSEHQWWELRSFLEELSDNEKPVRSLKRLALGYQTTLKPSCPLVIPATLQYWAGLNGDDVLIVFEDDYMEIWSDYAIGSEQLEITG